MSFLDSLGGIFAQYAPGAAAPADVATHFDQVAQTADSTTVASGIAAALRSDQTPDFGTTVSQLFANASPAQKAGMLNALLASAPAGLRDQLAGLIPGAAATSAPVTGAQVSAVPPDVVASIASRLHQQSGTIVDTMSAFYAQHPTLVKTLGSAAMVIAMRKMAEHHMAR
jgi:hypothetical protein